MKKFLLISLFCFLVGIACVYGVNAYLQMKVRREFIEQIQPNLTPSQVLQYYWQSATANQIEDVKLFATTIPSSFWVRCEGQQPSSNSTGLEDGKHGKEFTGLTSGVISYTAMLRASRPSLTRLRIVSERIYENEAVVDFEYEVTSEIISKERAYFFNDTSGWKLFIVWPTDSLSHMIIEEYAAPREKCDPLRATDGPPFDFISPMPVPRISSGAE
jgi:hypothetical protein